MQNKKMIALTLGIVAVVGLGVYFASSTQDGLQGFLKIKAPVLSPVRLSPIHSKNVLQINLSPQSPSGSRPVAPIDNVATYNFCSNGLVKVKTINFGMTASDGDLSDQVTLNSIKIGGNDVEGALTAFPNNEDPTFYYSAKYVLDSAIQIPSGECREVKFYFDTAASLDEDAAMDDPLRFSVQKVYNTDKKEITSNVPVSANTLNY